MVGESAVGPVGPSGARTVSNRRGASGSVELLRGFGALVDRAHRYLILTRMFIVSVIVVIFGATRRVRGENQSLKLARGV
jgi:hypothetical protein